MEDATTWTSRNPRHYHVDEAPPPHPPPAPRGPARLTGGPYMEIKAIEFPFEYKRNTTRLNFLQPTVLIICRSFLDYNGLTLVTPCGFGQDWGLAKMNELRVADGNLRTSAVTEWRVDASVIPAIDDVCSMPESPSTGADLQTALITS